MMSINRFDIKVTEKQNNYTLYDFFVDDQALSKMLGIDKSEDMDFSDSDLDIFEVDKEKYPNYNRKIINLRFVEQLLGKAVPVNQFGTKRITLYRCHCGSDYCGTISFELKIEQDYVYWQDIRYENDTDLDNTDISKIANLKFEKEEYWHVIERYARRIK